MTQLVMMHNQQAVTSSLQVAETFGKRHGDVIRAIEAKLQPTQNCVGYRDMFAEGTYIDGKGESRKMYYMNRDGFTFIAFGFTGAKADQFKLDYINAFNQLEQQAQLQVPQTLPDALRLAADLADERDTERSGRLIAEQQVGELKPKADYYDRILRNPGLVTTTSIAKNYGWSASRLNKELHKLHIQFCQTASWYLYSKYQDKGYTHTEPLTFKDSDGTEHVRPSTKWTQKGHLFIYETLKKHDIYPMIERLDEMED